MYQTYLWKIEPLSSYMTPWQSDTIYGHLLWGIVLKYGEYELKQILNDFKNGNPPFIVSNGFLNSRLPLINKNIIKNQDIESLSVHLKESVVNVATKIKRLKNIPDTSIEIFNKLRKKENNILDMMSDILEDDDRERLDELKTFSIENIHNKIDRLTGNTRENSIFSMKESFVKGHIAIFIKLNEGYSLEKLEELLKFVEDNGFGKKTSVGKGAFRTISFEKYDGFEKVAGNGYITLSNYIPNENDYDYVENSDILIKRGKVGNFYGDNKNPFKKPFSCFKPGSIFRGDCKKIKGKILNNLAENKEIVQIGIPFIVEVEL